MVVCALMFRLFFALAIAHRMAKNSEYNRVNNLDYQQQGYIRSVLEIFPGHLEIVCLMP